MPGPPPTIAAVDALREVPQRHRLGAGERGLRCRVARAEHALESHPACTLCDSEHAADASYPAVERELADGRMTVELVVRQLPRRREDGECDRQVVTGALLAQTGRREVDGHASARKLELRGA